MFKRWRNSHGFGVHSPFGYQLVERVIKCPKDYAYYAYADIDRCCRREHYPQSIASEAKMLLRLVCFLKPQSFYLPPDSGKMFQLALKKSNSNLRIVRNPAKADSCNIIATCGNDIPIDTLKDYISCPGKSILLKDAPDSWSESLFEAMNEGIMIRGKKNTILISRPEMQKISYQMYI